MFIVLGAVKIELSLELFRLQITGYNYIFFLKNLKRFGGLEPILWELRYRYMNLISDASKIILHQHA